MDYAEKFERAKQNAERSGKQAERLRKGASITACNLGAFLYIRDSESALATYKEALELYPENKTAKHWVKVIEERNDRT